MLDNRANQFLKPILERISLFLLKFNFLPNQLTFLGFIVGCLSFVFLSTGMVYVAFIFFIINRIIDGTDGTMARLTKPTDLGGYYDIISDFFIYALIPFGFILFDEKNYLSMSFLLLSFMGTCATFLTTAWIFEKKKMELKITSEKSFHYSNGLIEGTETIIFFSLMFLFNQIASLVAWIFAILCIFTSVMRVINVRKVLISTN